MSDSKSAGAPALDTNIESGGFDEKSHQQEQAPAAPALAGKAEKVEPEEEPDEDIDALIEELESQDGHGDDEEEGEEQAGGGRSVPDDMLRTDSRAGLTEAEVQTRRRKYGLNQMNEEKENLILKFLGYFIGPIQFVMEVSLCIVLVTRFFISASFWPHLAAYLACFYAANFTFCEFGTIRNSNTSCCHSSKHQCFGAPCRAGCLGTFSPSKTRWGRRRLRAPHKLRWLQQLAHRTGWIMWGLTDPSSASLQP